MLSPTRSKVHLWAPSFREFGGGIAAFSRELALGVLDCGVEPLLFGKHDQGSEHWKGLTACGAGSIPMRLRTPVFAAMALAKALREKPAEIISTHLNFGPLARFIKRVTGIPYTLVAHGIDVDQAMPASRLEALRGADRILAVSHWTRERVLALGGIDPGKVLILPNTYDEERFSPAPARAPQLFGRYAIAADEKVISPFPG
ncbi:glycosyltransferase [Haloferula sp. BvORR071]|uniref:glycosyltransferase n=1 Tax=Haloferula sp. BvORR071 TaxID=1396141 RepID=UPI0006983B40|nr:glycosyltransferase [Haloferula sp. BvORR071]